MITVVGGSNDFLLMIVPLMWLSKLRRVRYWYKVLRNMVVCICLKYDFLLPFLPAALQVLAREVSNRYHANDWFFNISSRRRRNYRPIYSHTFRSAGYANGGLNARSTDENEFISNSVDVTSERVIFQAGADRNSRELCKNPKLSNGHKVRDNDDDHGSNRFSSSSGGGRSSGNMKTSGISRNNRAVHEQDDYDEYEDYSSE